MRMLSVLIFFFALRVTTCFAQMPGYINCQKPGKYEIKMSPSGTKAVISQITVVKYSPPMLHRECWGVMQDIPEDTPITVIGEIRFKVKGKDFIAPLSCYADLSNSSWAMLQKVGSHYRLLLDGGDAAAGYTLTLDFDNWHVISRTVHLGENPEAVWEETKYHIDTTAWGQ
jgi:hypothetical protein